MDQPRARRPDDRGALAGARRRRRSTVPVARSCSRDRPMSSFSPSNGTGRPSMSKYRDTRRRRRGQVAPRGEHVGRRRLDLRGRRARCRRAPPTARPTGRAGGSLLVGEKRPPQPRGRHRGGVQEADVGAARRRDPPGDLVGLEARVQLVEGGDRRDQAHSVQRREVPAPAISAIVLPHDTASASPGPSPSLAISSSAGSTSTCSGGGDDDHAPQAERGAERLRQVVGRGRAADLDVHDPLVARELEQPRDRGAGHAEPLRDLLLGELVAVVELGRGDQRRCLHICAGHMLRHR